jgi:hypothetical protein
METWDYSGLALIEARTDLRMTDESSNRQPPNSVSQDTGAETFPEPQRTSQDPETGLIHLGCPGAYPHVAVSTAN